MEFKKNNVYKRHEDSYTLEIININRNSRYDLYVSFPENGISKFHYNISKNILIGVIECLGLYKVEELEPIRYIKKWKLVS